MALTYVQKQHASGTMTEREREGGVWNSNIQFLFSLELCGLDCICNKSVYYFNEHFSVDTRNVYSAGCGNKGLMYTVKTLISLSFFISNIF